MFFLSRKTEEPKDLARSAAGNGCRSSEKFIQGTSFQCPKVPERRQQQGKLCKSNKTVHAVQMCHVMFVGFCVCVLGLFVPLFF